MPGNSTNAVNPFEQRPVHCLRADKFIVLPGTRIEHPLMQEQRKFVVIKAAEFELWFRAALAVRDFPEYAVQSPQKPTFRFDPFGSDYLLGDRGRCL
jgi:hypothetical protein